MKSLITAGTVFLVALLVTPVLADKGQSSYKQGRDLEDRQNYEGAYASYERAYDADPRDTRYRSALPRIRFVAGASIVHRATLLQAERLEEALTLFEEAVGIDSSRPIATQQVLNTRNMIQQARGNRAESASPSGPELSPDILDAQGPVKLNGMSSLPVTLKLSQDTKIVYQTIGQLAGVNVLFDPDRTSRQLNIELNGVTLQEALDLVAAESKTFWKTMTRNKIFVAADTSAKRKELDENVIKAFYLSNLTAPTEIQDLVNTLRSVFDVNRVQQLASQEAIVIRGTPDQVLLAEKIVSDFDKAPAEAVVDFALMEVSRDKVHTLGISPPTSASVQLQTNIGGSSGSINGSSTNGSNNSTGLSSSSSTSGMLQQQDAQSRTGIPGLSQSPILKCLFSQKNTEVMDSEIVFVVIPHIVRRKDLNEFNGRTLDVGPANSIHLRHAPGTIPNLESDNGSETIPATKPSGETSAALKFDPTAISVAEGTTFTLDVVLSGAQNVYSVPLQIAYDKQGLQLANVSNGKFLSQGEQVVALVHREDPSTGAVEITASRPLKSEGVSGHGVIATLTFEAKTAGRFPVKITKAALVHPNQQLTSTSGSEGTVSVH